MDGKKAMSSGTGRPATSAMKIRFPLPPPRDKERFPVLSWTQCELLISRPSFDNRASVIKTRVVSLFEPQTMTPCQ